jgi:hypothetical protein
VELMCPNTVLWPYELKLEPFSEEMRLEGSGNYVRWARRAKAMLKVKTNGVEHYLEDTCAEPDDKSSEGWKVWKRHHRCGHSVADAFDITIHHPFSGWWSRFLLLQGCGRR